MKNKRIPGIIITLIQLIASGIFMGLLFRTKMIPNKYLLVIGAGLLFMTAIIYVLTRDAKNKSSLISGICLMLIMIAMYGIGGNYLSKGINTLSNITMTTTEKSDIAIYVRKDDKASEIADTVGYEFGILGELDRKNTDVVVSEVSDEIGEIEPKEYIGITELANSLVEDKETDAIIMNREFLHVLTEIEGYEEIEGQLKEIHREEVETEKEVKEEPKEENSGIPTTFTVYISGIDSREGLVAKSRSDVNIIATVNTEKREVLLVSTPRDYFVPLSISNGAPDKLTHAGIYGVDVSMDTLEMLYQTQIDYYFRVNFNGFEEIIDALGGITIMSDYTFDSQNEAGYSFVQGENQVDGAAALAFVRERYAFNEGDRQRGKNQLAVIEGVINKATSSALLENYSEILKSVEGSFETSVPYDVIAKVVRKQLSEGGSWKVTSYSVDGTGATEMPYSMSTNAYVMVPDYSTVDTAISMIHQVKED